jgi:hypothetical protein
MKKLLLALMMVALLSTVAMAAVQNQPVSQVVSAGSLMIAGNGDFAFDALTLSAIPFTAGIYETAPTAEPTFTLTDFRGTGQGWNVVVKCTAITAGGHSLDFKYAQTSANATVTKVLGQAVNGTNGPKIEDITEATIPSDTLAVNTNEGYGMGQYTYTLGAEKIVVPDTAYAGTYTGTFTASIISGPGGTGSWTGTIQ